MSINIQNEKSHISFNFFLIYIEMSEESKHISLFSISKPTTSHDDRNNEKNKNFIWNKNNNQFLIKNLILFQYFATNN